MYAEGGGGRGGRDTGEDGLGGGDAIPPRKRRPAGATGFTFCISRMKSLFDKSSRKNFKRERTFKRHR